jgi:hypothetical protein
MAARTGYLAKVGLIYVLCLGDLVINGIADHNQIPDAASFIPFVWIGCVCGVGEERGGEWEREVGNGPLSFRIAQPLTAPRVPHPCPSPHSPRSVQFAIQILNLLLLFLLFFGTYLFQVGLLGEVFREFRPALIAMTLYLGVFSAYAGTKLSLLVGPPGLGQEELWSKSLTFVALSVLQKIAALLYYVMVLQTTLRLGEAKWYQRAPWVARYSDLAAATAAAAKAGMVGGGGLTRR